MKSRRCSNLVPRPPYTSLNSRCPLFDKSSQQLLYPCPSPQNDDFKFKTFSDWLTTNATVLGCIIFEPQWGSSQCGLVWTPDLLRLCIAICQSHSIPCIADEIMCGMGRYGHGPLFASKALELNVDVATFGKSIMLGVSPQSSAVSSIKEGRS